MRLLMLWREELRVLVGVVVIVVVMGVGECVCRWQRRDRGHVRIVCVLGEIGEVWRPRGVGG